MHPSLQLCITRYGSYIIIIIVTIFLAPFGLNMMLIIIILLLIIIIMKIGVTIEKAQKWIVSQNCETVKWFMWQ